MAYIINIFSPATWNAFLNSSRNFSGATAKGMAHRQIHPGDVFICYLTGLSRWCGVLEVISEPFHTDTGLYNIEDPYVVRVTVKPIVCLLPEFSVPIKDDEVWSNLSFTKGLTKNSKVWTGHFRKTHNVLSATDGEFLNALLRHQSSERQPFPLSTKDKRRWRRGTGLTTPPVPSATDGEHQPTADYHEPEEPTPEVRESILMQAKIAQIGIAMGLSVWIPANDRARVLDETPETAHGSFLTELNLAYPSNMLNTIKQIDVLWLDRDDNIMRAFEVEHTTAIYSGLLRMTDLRALQPNMTINLHIIAPADRERKVLNEIRRPTFRRFALSNHCSFLSYAKVEEIAALPHLRHLSSDVITDYEVRAEG